MPEKPSDLATLIAYSGFPNYGTTSYAAQDERHRELQGARRDVVFAEMSEGDSLIAVTFNIMANLAAQVRYTFVPADSEDPEAVANAEEFDVMWKGLKTPWLDVVKEQVRGTGWGYSLHEMVVSMVDGQPTLVDLFHIRQDSRYCWHWGEGGREVIAVEQLTRSGQHATIPTSKILHFRADKSSGDPEGRPLLRPLYKDYRALNTVTDYSVIGVGKDATGMVVARVPVKTFTDSLQMGSAEQANAAAAITAITKNTSAMQRGAREGMVFPSKTDEYGKETGYDIQLLHGGGARQFDHLALIRYFEGRIARGLLTQFLLLGSDKAGSFALSSDQTELLGVALGGLLDAMTDAVNEQVVGTICDLKGIPKALRPSLTRGPLDKPDLSKLGTYIKDMIAAGVLTPDARLEEYVRDAGELPPLDATKEAM